MPKDTTGVDKQDAFPKLVEAGHEVRPGELITPGIAGSLEPEFTLLIGEIDGSAYAVSGEVAAAGDDFVSYRMRDGSAWTNDAREEEAATC